MSLSSLSLVVTSVGFILALLTLAIAAERRIIPERWSTSTLVYVLSIGVAASSTSLSAISFAATTEYGYFVYYFGGATMFLLGSILLQYIHRLMARYHFENVFDLLAFRYRRAWVGPIITVMGVVAMLPIIADQLNLLANTATLIHHQGRSYDQHLPYQLIITFVFSAAIVFFNVVLSSYRSDRRHRNNGLIVLVALSSLVCIVVLYGVGFLAVTQVFKGADNYQVWLSSGAANELLKPSVPIGLKSVLLLSFGSALCLPHIFHLSFGEAPQRKTFQRSFWAFPLLLLLFSLPILPIAAAGNKLLPEALPLHYLSLIPLHENARSLSLLVLVAQIAAFFSVTIVLCMVATTTLINYLILPVFKPRNARNLQTWMRSARRIVGAVIMLLSWLLVNLSDSTLTLHIMFIHAMAVFAQLLPGIIALVYFPRISSWGFMLGLISGIGSYLSIVFVAAAHNCYHCPLDGTIGHLAEHSVALSLAVNIIIMWLTSFVIKPNAKDQLAAELTAISGAAIRGNAQLSQRSPRDFITALVPLVGAKEANFQVAKALRELKLTEDEQRPFALIQLRNSLERNLSRLLGPSIAQNTINQLLPYSLTDGSFPNHHIEQSLNQLEPSFTGIAGEIDRLRRFHYQTLSRLPVGVCYVNHQREIMLWNTSLQQLTGLNSEDTEGAKTSQLPQPWRQLIEDFLDTNTAVAHKVTVTVNDTPRWLTLHKDKPSSDNRLAANEDKVIVIEDITDLKTLEDELIHNERLASIGRLAAGVAHEIGNPVTGIACLAQNLKLDSDDPEVLATSAEIMQQTNRISAIMHSLVSFSHGGSSQAEHISKPVNLSECINEAIALVRLDRLATQVNFEFIAHDDVTVDGDEQRLHQIFVNLLSNARDASYDGAIVSTEVKRQHTHAVITVSDDGSGIAPAIQARVFEPFFTTKEPGQGTGLGLALVHSIIDDHGGSIHIDSPINGDRGTRFTIQLPLSSTVAP